MLLFNTFPIWLNVFLLGLCVLDNDPLYLVVMLNNDELACLILLYPKIHYIHCYWWTLIYKKCYEAFKSSLSFNNLFWFNPNFVFASYCWLMIFVFHALVILDLMTCPFLCWVKKCVWAKLYLALFNLFFADKILLSDFCSVITLTCFVSCIAYSFVWGLIFCYWWLVINFADCW